MNQNSNKITNKNIMVENINRLLYQKNWSIRQLADEAELPYESVKKLVGGKVNNPTIYTISKVCDALNCSIDYILGRSVINTIDKNHFHQGFLIYLWKLPILSPALPTTTNLTKPTAFLFLRQRAMFRMEWFLTVFLRILLIFLLTKKILVTLFCVGLILLGEIFHLLILTMTFF